MDQWIQAVVAFTSEHRFWAGPIVFGLAFAESMVVLSLVVPFTTVIIASGALIGAGTLDPWIVLPWGIAGAAFGDAVSYWIGLHFDDKVPRVWPFRDKPELLEDGHRFFRRWGVMAVFIGRFFGPLRAVVPVIAGMMDMPQRKFQIANVVSAIVWMPALMLPGAIAGYLFNDSFPEFADQAFVYTFIVLLLFPIVVGAVAWLRRRGRADKASDSTDRLS
jgi:membrane protein DedA with SNARE-associated domain